MLSEHIYDFETLLIQERRCVVFECSYDSATDKWAKVPRNGRTLTPYHNESDLSTYQICAEAARRYDKGPYYKGLVGVRTGKLTNGLYLYCCDFDHQRAHSGEWSGSVKTAAKLFDSFTEESVSGTGAHIFLLCERPYLEDVGRRDHTAGQVFWANQSIATTGDLLSFDECWKSPEYVRLVEPATLFAWIDTNKTQTQPTKADHKSAPKKTKVIPPQAFTESDDSVLHHAYTEKDGDKIRQLFEVGLTKILTKLFKHHCQAIGFLACKLAFHSGYNIPQMEHLIKTTAVWKEQPRSDNWLKDTCENACCVVTATRKPKAPKVPTAEEKVMLFIKRRKELKLTGEVK